MPQTSLLTDPLQVAARTAWGEARGEGAVGMQAVLCAARNRLARPAWWGRDICSVFLHPWQFSCWNMGDPNRALLLAVTGADPQFQIALALAAKLVGGSLIDITSGADSYYDTRLAHTPAWAASRLYRCTIGHHAFYRVGPSGEG
ncbi:cell wall hydrolase [Acetobacter suratthaniensis]|uniref:Cell wall hydrolase n=1 Tax=Acetobacter suratthaniensis TaxID=1502841 RepID=A0ABS3LPC1_9PROT|nr:cell wall hydrolase [Acetobacter suratthaniensis]MBO1329234.1 cell wall hydrolase [Acetobacter suratthaniensis]MCX2567322.1 cell wall hydrolase [Acetobacter suratthaniensis]